MSITIPAEGGGNFINPYTTVATLAASGLTGIVSATDYDVDPTGSRDSTVGLMAWLAAAGTSQLAYLPPGTYLTTGITALGNSTASPHIVGAGPEQSILRGISGVTAVLTLGVAVGQASAPGHIVEFIGVDGGDIADYGIFVSDNAVRATLNQVAIQNCTGTPGAGIANENHAYSNWYNRITAQQNNIGMRLTGLCQDTKITNSQLASNLVNQLVLGDGTTNTNIVTVENTQLERGNQGTGGDVTNLLIAAMHQVVLRSVYCESHTTAGSNDITVAASTQPTELYIENMFGIGNSVANNSIVLPNDTTTPVTLILIHPQLINYINNPPVTNFTNTNKWLTIIDESGKLGLGNWTDNSPLRTLVGSPNAELSGLTITANTGIISHTGTTQPLMINYGATTDVALWNGGGGGGHALLTGSISGDGISIKSGTVIKGHLSASGTLTFTAIAAGTSQEQSLTVPGAAVGDSVSVTPGGALAGGLVWSGYVSAANTVTIRVANVTSGSITPAALTWRADIWQH